MIRSVVLLVVAFVVTTILIAVLAGPAHAQAVSDVPMRDCADVMMHSAEGPDPVAARAAWDCASPVFRSGPMRGSVEAVVKMNADFQPARAERVGKSDHYVFYVVRFLNGDPTMWYVVTLNDDGFVTAVD